MPSTPPPANQQTQTDSHEDRELYVIDDFASIPWSQSRPLTKSFGDWLATGWRHKILRKEVKSKFLVECGRFTSARHVPKRIQKYFDEFPRELKSQGFHQSFQGTLAAIGPYSTATLGMSRKDGEVHFFATQIVTQVDRKIQDKQYFGFVSWLADQTSVWTFSKCSLLPSPPRVNRMVLPSKKPNQVLRKHEERIRGRKLQRVAPANYFDSFKSEHDTQVNTWKKQKIIRLAKPAEITRIRHAKS